MNRLIIMKYPIDMLIISMATQLQLIWLFNFHPYNPFHLHQKWHEIDQLPALRNSRVLHLFSHVPIIVKRLFPPIKVQLVQAFLHTNFFLQDFCLLFIFFFSLLPPYLHCIIIILSHYRRMIMLINGIVRKTTHNTIKIEETQKPDYNSMKNK